MTDFNRIDVSTIEMLFKKNDYATLRIMLVAPTYTEDLLIIKDKDPINTYILEYLYVDNESKSKIISRKYSKNSKEWENIYHRIKKLVREGNKGEEISVKDIKIEDNKIEINYTRNSGKR